MLSGTLFAALSLLASTPAMSQSIGTQPTLGQSSPLERTISFGPKVGVSTGPEQLVLGGSVEISNITSQPIGISAGGLVGLGDGLTTYRAFGHATYDFPLTGQDITLYPLGGISFIRYDFNCDEFFGSAFDCSFNEFGLDIGGGATYQNFKAEIWLGLGDVPDATLSLSYLF